MSSQLSCALVDQPGNLPVSGLSRIIKADGSKETKVENQTRELALALASRVFKAAQSQHVPLPVLIGVAASPSLVTGLADAIDSPIIKQDRSLAVSSGFIKKSVMTPNAVLSAILSPKMISASNTAMIPKISMMGRQAALDPILASSTTSVTSRTPLAAIGSSSSNIERFPKALKATADMRQRTPGYPQASVRPQVDGSSDQAPLSEAQRITPLSDMGHSSLTATASLPLPTFTALRGSDPKGSGGRVSDATRAIEIALNPNRQAVSLLPVSWSRLGEGRSSSPTINSSYQMALPSIPLPAGGSGYRQNLRLSEAITAGTGHVMRTSTSATVHPTISTAPTVSASSAIGGNHDSTPATMPHSINLTGAVNLDGRRLGRLTASSQARDASLPSRGPSRVNLRTVPLYSGMRIPS